MKLNNENNNRLTAAEQPGKVESWQETNQKMATAATHMMREEAFRNVALNLKDVTTSDKSHLPNLIIETQNTSGGEKIPLDLKFQGKDIFPDKTRYSAVDRILGTQTIDRPPPPRGTTGDAANRALEAWGNFADILRRIAVYAEITESGGTVTPVGDSGCTVARYGDGRTVVLDRNYQVMDATVRTRPDGQVEIVYPNQRTVVLDAQMKPSSISEADGTRLTRTSTNPEEWTTNTGAQVHVKNVKVWDQGSYSVYDQQGTSTQHRADLTTETFGILDIQSGSERFTNDVEEALESIPASIRKELEDNGYQIIASEKLTDADPTLRGVRPRGWPPGSSWENVDGVFQRDDARGIKRVIIAEKYLYGTSWVNSDRVQGTMRHEIGHAVDNMWGQFSSSPEFMLAYNADKARIPVAIQGQLEYFTQAGNAGPQETFAEIFAVMHGGGARSDLTDVMRRMFPTVFAAIRAREAGAA